MVEVWYKFGPLVGRGGELYCNSSSATPFTKSNECLQLLTLPGCRNSSCTLDEFQRFVSIPNVLVAVSIANVLVAVSIANVLVAVSIPNVLVAVSIANVLVAVSIPNVLVAVSIANVLVAVSIPNVLVAVSIAIVSVRSVSSVIPKDIVKECQLPSDTTTDMSISIG